MDDINPGLRERKRMETAERLERAAIELASELGYDNVTVEAISERAGVSARTFFNYFTSKEDAVIGASQPELDDSLREIHRERYGAADLVTSLVGLHLLVFGPALEKADLRRARLLLMRDRPELMARKTLAIARTSDEIAKAALEVVRERREHSRSAGFDVLEADEGAVETLAFACIGAIRVALREWAETGKEFSAATVERRAVDLMRKAHAL